MTESRFKFDAKAKTGEIFLYDMVGEDFFGEGMTDKRFVSELKKMGDVETIHLYVNSPGGDVFMGNTIYDLLREHPAKVIAEVHGLAASIASVIVQAADELTIAANGLYMIHKPSSFTFGNAADLRRRADVLDQAETTIVKAYKRRVKMSDEQLSQMLTDETWMTADEALAHGFVDSIRGEMKVAACADLDKIAAKLGFQKMPQIAAVAEEPPKEKLWNDMTHDEKVKFLKERT